MKRLTLWLACLFISMIVAIAQTKQVSGTVVDEAGEPMFGASIVVKGKAAIGTTTDLDGNFSFTIPESATTLVIKYIYYKDVEVDVALVRASSHGYESSNIEVDSKCRFIIKMELIKMEKRIRTQKAKPIIFIENSGTGWALSSDGYIVTNYHVIKNASQIKVKGINGDFNESFFTFVVAEDRVSDLAIIKMCGFVNLGTIPYVISTKEVDVGSKVYALGYPLTHTMGNEIKMTDGIISSNSGYLGDKKTYQTTVPVRPGNSGCPLFDDNGIIVGIISSRDIGESNASYAIKTNYLMNLLSSITPPPNLQTVNTFIGKPLTELKKTFEKYVYIIEVSH